MKIELTDNTKMHTAISLANRRRFYDALCIFAQIESYESVLNQIVCLCESEDVAYAVDLYRYAKQKYRDRSLYADILQFDGLTGNILMFCEPDEKYARACDGKISADPSLLINLDDSYDDDDYSAPDLDYAADTELYDDPKLFANNFFDVKSTRYFDSLRVNMEKSIMEGDEEAAKKYSKRLLALETDHLPTLEAQISLTLYTEKYNNGIQYAKRLANAEGGSHAAIGGAIDIIMHVNPSKHLETLKKLMYKALDVIDDITDYDLEDYIYIATTYVRDLDMAYKFAQTLYKNFKNISLEALHMCACAFYNHGDVKSAREAALSLLHAVPRSCYARILAEYIGKTPYAKNQLPMDVPPRVLRHFCMPTKLTVYANHELCTLLDASADMKLGEKELFYVSVLILYCKSLILTNQQKQYYQTASFLRALLQSCTLDDVNSFVDFAKTQLFSTMDDQCITETLIGRLIDLGVKEKIYIGLTSGYYVLDFGKVNSFDPLYVAAFAICASLVRIDDPTKYEAAFDDICKTVPIDENDEAIAHKVAFAMLCIRVKKFVDEPVADYFVEAEYATYREYRAAKRNKKQ